MKGATPESPYLERRHGRTAMGPVRGVSSGLARQGAVAGVPVRAPPVGLRCGTAGGSLQASRCRGSGLRHGLTGAAAGGSRLGGDARFDGGKTTETRSMRRSDFIREVHGVL